MTKKRNKILMIVIPFVLIIALAIVYYVMTPQPVNAMLVGFSNMLKYDDHIYMEQSISKETKDRLYQDLEQSKTRLLDYFDEIQSTPTVIFVQSREALERYAQHSTGQTYYMYWGNYIVIGPSGFNQDVIAHELMHAELRKRVKNKGRFPVWFDEGLATLVDQRIVGGEEHAKNRNDLDVLKDRSAFYDAKKSGENYKSANYEVNRWYTIVGKTGLNDLIDGLNEQGDFKDLYEKIENSNK
ncbi:hypothetical protein V3851_08275 [Paenibacillus sp. M1]|uniref:Peptidase MA superfamily protein n=1 Tax=Paenibacillus haidiansis TaxID=1574488 RepID=A0ABU7VSG9_9BACL